jgi:HD-GYP domain-containing protein (c-di-GMP phosphodiesterase class II)
MTTDRPYRNGISKEKAIVEIKECINKQFNHKPAEALIELFNKGDL